MMGNKPLDDSTDRLFEDALQQTIGRLQVIRKEPGVGLKLLSRFDELKKYQSLFVHKVTELKGATGSFIILLVEKHLTIIEQKRSGRVEKEIEEIEPVIVFRIPQDVGRVFIKEETITDKIVDLFIKVDIDFAEYPTFSNHYCVVGENPDLVKKYLPKGLLQSLDIIKGMTVEINGNLGLIRPEKNLTESLLLLLLSIGYKMTK